MKFSRRRRPTAEPTRRDDPGPMIETELLEAIAVLKETLRRAEDAFSQKGEQ